MTKEEKIEYIVNNYTRLMHAKAYSVLGDSYEAEDACQEAFMKLYRVLDRVSDVTTPEARSYCVMTARNAAIDLYRKTRHEVPVEEVYDEAKSVFDVYPSDTADMLNDIEELPSGYRDVIRLRCLEERSAAETAKELSTSVNTVNIRLLRARKILRSKWLAGVVSVLIVCGLSFRILPGIRQQKAEAVPAAEAAYAVTEEKCAAEDIPAQALSQNASANGEAFAGKTAELPVSESIIRQEEPEEDTKMTLVILAVMIVFAGSAAVLIVRKRKKHIHK